MLSNYHKTIPDITVVTECGDLDIENKQYQHPAKGLFRSVDIDDGYLS